MPADVMAAAAAVSLFAAGVAALLRFAGRITRLEERGIAAAEEEERARGQSDRQAQALQEMRERLARIDQKLDMLLRVAAPLLRDHAERP